MRIQSLLFMRLYKLKKDHVMRNVKARFFVLWFKLCTYFILLRTEAVQRISIIIIVIIMMFVLKALLKGSKVQSVILELSFF